MGQLMYFCYLLMELFALLLVYRYDDIVCGREDSEEVYSERCYIHKRCQGKSHSSDFPTS